MVMAMHGCILSEIQVILCILARPLLIFLIMMLLQWLVASDVVYCMNSLACVCVASFSLELHYMSPILCYDVEWEA